MRWKPPAPPTHWRKTPKASTEKFRASATASNRSLSPPEAKTISASQRYGDSLLEHFTKLIELLSAEPTYAPNETDLQVSALIIRLGDLKIANTAVINAYANYNNARITRNAILYSAVGGLAGI